MPEFDLKILIWIIIFIVYVVKQFRKLLSVPSTQPVDSAPNPLPKQVSNKDKESKKLIKDANTDKRILGPKHQIPLPTSRTEPIKKSAKQENRSLEVIDYDTNITTDAMLSAKFKMELEQHRTEKIIGKEDKQGHFEEYSTIPSPTSDLVKKLRNPSDLRDAVILSDILQRKY